MKKVGNEVIINNTWSYISTENKSNDENIEHLFVFLYNEFELIFGSYITNGIYSSPAF